MNSYNNETTMNCDFIKSLSSEQKEELRKLLDEDATTPKYRVEVEFHDEEKTKIYSLREYLGNKLHGVCKYWYNNGQLMSEAPYYNGLRHGVQRNWHDNGLPSFRAIYRNGKLNGIELRWDTGGKLRSKVLFEDGAYKQKLAISEWN